MNSTNRFGNRLLLLLVGLVLLALGAAATAAALVPAVRNGWDGTAQVVDDAVTRALQATPLGGTEHSWILVAVAGVLALAIVILVVAVFRRGGGHTATVATTAHDALGEGSVDVAVAQQTLQDALGRRDEFLSAKVTAYRVHRAPALYVAVRCRRGISPAQASDTVHRVVAALDSLLGTELPVLIHVSGGFRSRVASTTRLDAAAA